MNGDVYAKRPSHILFTAKITSAKIKVAPAKKECIKFCCKFTYTIHFYILIIYCIFEIRFIISGIIPIVNSFFVS